MSNTGEPLVSYMRHGYYIVNVKPVSSFPGSRSGFAAAVAYRDAAQDGDRERMRRVLYEQVLARLEKEE